MGVNGDLVLARKGFQGGDLGGGIRFAGFGSGRSLGEFVWRGTTWCDLVYVHTFKARTAAGGMSCHHI